MTSDEPVTTSDETAAAPEETVTTSQEGSTVVLSAEDPAPETVSFTCPRCGEAAEARFYGPCPTCMGALQGKYLQSTNEVEAPEYEPKMNVTPNAIATKE